MFSAARLAVVPFQAPAPRNGIDTGLHSGGGSFTGRRLPFRRGPRSPLRLKRGLGSPQGKYAEAEPLHQRALAIREKALGPEHPHVAQTLENYAVLLRQTARADEAERMEARAPQHSECLELPVWQGQAWSL